MEELVLKKFKILLVTILSATLLCGCSGCGIDFNNKQNVDDSNDSGKSVESDKLIDDISKFKITDVVSVNCVKGYPVNDFGFALCKEQTVNLIGLGDKGNLHYALTILACSEDYARDFQAFEDAFSDEDRNKWLDVEYNNKLNDKTDEEIIELVKSNDSIWIEYGESSLNDKAGSNVDGYIWLMDDSEHNSDNFINSYNYQMLRGDFCVYVQDNNSKYIDKFSDVNKGENIVVYGATVEQVFNAGSISVVFDNHVHPVCVDLSGLSGFDSDNYEYSEQDNVDVSAVIKPGDYIYVELDFDETIPEDNDYMDRDVSGYVWKNSNVYNNHDDFMNYNYLGLCVKNGLISIEDISDFNKYYDKILRYYNGY